MPYQQLAYYFFVVSYYVYVASFAYVWWRAIDMNKRHAEFAKEYFFGAIGITIITPILIWYCSIFMGILKPD